MRDKKINKLKKSELVELIHEMQSDEKPKKIMPTDPIMVQLENERKKLNYKARFKKTFFDIVSVLLVAAAAAVLLSTLFLPVIQISGDSMEPSLRDGDIMMLYKTKKYKTGELCCISWQNKLLMKRIIGLPGDYINIEKDGTVFVNDKALDEPYVTNKCLGECDMTFPYQVPDGKLFVMGDRRDVSIDSRSSSIGCIEKDQIVGQVLFKIWPFR